MYKRVSILVIALVSVISGGCGRSAPASDDATSPVKFQQIQAAGSSFHVAKIDHVAALNLYWKDTEGNRYSTFARLRDAIERSHRKLLFATNAGIFDPDHSPAGFYVENGVEGSPLNLKEGVGNFYLKPNGVFLVDDTRAAIVEASEYVHQGRNVRVAIQSGPLLLSHGRMHPAITADSTNTQVRSGVGVTRAGEIVFVLSKESVTFYALASVFRDELECHDALYLDGTISQFFEPNMTNEKEPEDFAGMFGVTSPGN